MCELQRPRKKSLYKETINSGISMAQLVPSWHDVLFIATGVAHGAKQLGVADTGGVEGMGYPLLTP